MAEKETAAQPEIEISDNMVSLQAEFVEGRNYTVLFADDDPHTLFALEAIFRHKYKVLTALSAEAAEKILDAVVESGETISAICSDQVMTGKSGWDLLAIAKKKSPMTARILMTAFPLEEEIPETIQYIAKPWDPPNAIEKYVRNAVAKSVLMHRYAEKLASNHLR